MNIYKLKNIYNCRGYLFKFRSVHSASKPDAACEILTKQDAKISQNASGITVASVENYSPISIVSVAFKAGSRYENPHNLGVVHTLSNCAPLSTKNQSAFSLTRNLEIKGSKVNVTSSREHIIYTVQCIRDEIDSSIKVLADIITNPAFKPWEVNDSVYRMQLDLALLEETVEAALLENLHKVAYRGGLSNSLFCPPFMVGKHDTKILQDFIKENFIGSKTSVVGLGVSHDYLEDSVDKLLDLVNPDSPDGASKFGGGEIRIEKDIPFVHTAIVAEGAGLLNTKEALSLGVLQCILGPGAQTKLGGTSFSKLGIAASKCTSNPFVVSCLNINYSDTGLFGLYISGVPNDMQQLVKTVVAQMRDVTKNITDKDIQTAKHHLKARIRLSRDNSKGLLDAMITDASFFKEIRDIKDIEKSIDELTSSDISTVAARVMKTKPAMAAIGRLHLTPHIDELI